METSQLKKLTKQREKTQVTIIFWPLISFSGLTNHEFKEINCISSNKRPFSNKRPPPNKRSPKGHYIKQAPPYPQSWSLSWIGAIEEKLASIATLKLTFLAFFYSRISKGEQVIS